MSAESLYNDEELFSLLQQGEETAFNELYQRYWEPLFITAAKVLRSKEDAADIVQDVFLSLWRRRQSIQLSGTLSAYLQTSTRYTAIHYIEKNITRRDYLAMLTETEASIPGAPAESMLQLKQVQEAIQQTVNQMPPKMREVYQLSRKENMTHKEIAEKLGISDETVKKHIQHALQLIKTAIGKSSVSLTAVLITLMR